MQDIIGYGKILAMFQLQWEAMDGVALSKEEIWTDLYF